MLPDQYEKSIYDIDLEQLENRGIKGIIIDLDNTLVEWDRPKATPRVRKWLQSLQNYGMEVTIVSNNSNERVQAFSDPENISFIYAARKPRRRAFFEACEQMNITKDEAVVVGDQIFTDVLGGNRAGIHTILVVPVSNTDGIATKLNRFMERFVLRWMKKQGLIKWEE